ncbi:MAG: O-antigen ligase family protein [Solirubrobacteraceae bacterium]
MERPETLSRRVRAEGLPLIPAAVAIAVVVVWAFTGGGYEAKPVLGGGYDPNPWYLGALVLVGLWCATALGLARIRISRWAALACVALTAYTAFSFLSILWAHDQGAAFLGSVRALVYLAAFTTFAILPWSRWSLRIALVGLVAGLGAVAIVTAIRLATLANPSTLYLDARLVYPLGYYNADAALFMMTALVAVALACRRGGAPALRVAGLVVAAVCLQLAVLGQSRGWLFTVPLILAIALLIVPDRLRLLVFALGPAVATAVAVPALFQVYGKTTIGGETLTEPRLGHVLHSQGVNAAHIMLIADLALAIVAALAVALDRRVAPSLTTKRRVDRVVAALAVAAALAGVAIGLVAVHGHVVGRVEHAWNSFANANTGPSGSSRFTALGSQRVDFWRVALNEWDAHPLAGIGQDNFAANYLQHRRTGEEPRWAHSLELRLLVHTGLIGALLFVLFVVAVGIAALRGGGARGRPVRFAAAVALLPFVVWIVHGSIDWFWEFPALSVPALAFAGAACALGVDRASASTASGSRQLRMARLAAVAALGVGALAAVAIAYASAHEIQRATDIYSDHPAQAYAELHSASNLIPFDAQIYLLDGSIALDYGEAGIARHYFEQAARHDDEEWLAPFVLGLLASERGDRTQAKAQLRRALRLNPGEQILSEALTRAGRKHPMSVEEAQRILSTRVQTRFGR